MPKFVPYLSEDQIECDAASLLAEFALARGVVIAPPIPIEDIVEKHLKLGIEFDDMHRLLNHPRSGLGLDPDILGAIFFDERRIVIDESLDPEENPAMEGRYRFTLAHEGGGHWQLHRHLFAKDPAQASLFDGPVAPSVVCRSSRAKEPVERQADYYASCLLMPRALVFAIWRYRFGEIRPLVHSRNVRINPRRNRTYPRQIAEVFPHTPYDDFADGWSEYFAPMFKVSRQAMRIRLEKLGLLLPEVPQQRVLAGGA